MYYNREILGFLYRHVIQKRSDERVNLFSLRTMKAIELIARVFIIEKLDFEERVMEKIVIRDEREREKSFNLFNTNFLTWFNKCSQRDD